MQAPDDSDRRSADSERNGGDDPPQISRGLPIFLGVLEFIGAFFSLIALLLMTASVAVTSRFGNVPGLGFRQLVPALLVYLLAAVFFTFMGIGTVKLKTWGRNLMLIFSSVLLVSGFVLLVFSFAALPGISRNIYIPFDDGTMAKLFSRIFIALVFVFFVVVPGLFVLLYSLPGVKRSFTLADPKPNWTDLVPLPVLGLSLFLWLSSFTSIINMVTGLQFPVFGGYLSVLSSRGMWLAFAAAAAYFGLLCYQRKIAGWAGGLVFILLLTGSSIVTAAIRGFYTMGLQMYGMDTYPGVDFSGFDRYAILFMGIITLLYLGFYLFCIRYFRSTGGPSSGNNRAST